MELVLIAAIAVLIGIIVTLRRDLKKKSSEPGAATPPKSSSHSPPGGPIERIYALAAPVNTFLDGSAHPQDLLTFDDFNKGVALFASEDVPVEEVAGYATGDNSAIVCMALEALTRRNDAVGVVARITDFAPYYWSWPVFYVIRYLRSLSPEPVLGRFLSRATEFWPRNPIVMEHIRETMGELQEPVLAAEVAAFRSHLTPETSAEVVRKVLQGVGGETAERFLDALNNWLGTHADVEKLTKFGTVWPPKPAESVVPHAALTVQADLVTSEIVLRSRSVMLVGERGVGKTALMQFVGARLQEEGWTVFETLGGRLLAGNIYIGAIEEHVLEVVEAVRVGRKVVWVIPAFHELAFAGRHKYSPTSILDLLMPHIERGEIVVVGETTPAGFERTVELQPRAATAFEVLRMSPPGTAETLALAVSATGLPHETASEALQLARLHLANLSDPGNVLHLLEMAVRRRATSGDGSADVTHEDLVVEVARITGLPRVILDDSHQLDLNGLRRHFTSRVVGQDEAVEVLVDRLAMIKAGLTDPTRPYGVFLFAGPTGTGKTEIAKTLAEFLFGSSDRMIRFDMSEFQTSESLVRLFGDADDSTSAARSLVRQVREHPFSIVLLDEFEKAHPRIWDTFLQVFDDGRLTDRRGNLASFRHCIIIMTSNLGAAFGTGPGIGFDSDRRSFSRAAVEKAVTEEFRSEFLNRIDRVVIFQPLSRANLRSVLQIELRRAFERRGLQSRDWAVEWDTSAIEFLLNRGYSAELGARPLKRAIERYLLSPLAQTIVEHEYPEGDQFMFVRASGDGLDVQFVDPDATEDQAVRAPAALVGEAESDIRTIALQAAGTAQEFSFLCAAFDQLRSIILSDEWSEHKATALAAMSEPDFWQSEGRAQTLSDIEYMDRIEVGLDTAGSLIGRLSGARGSDRQYYRPDVLQRLAQQLYLLDAACGSLVDETPRDAFLSIEASSDPGTEDSAALFAFVGELARMYLGWAERRRMRVLLYDPIEEREHSARVLLAISGFGSYRLLAPEHGLHVLEVPRDESSFSRLKARVRVAGQPADAGTEPGQLRRLSGARLANSEESSPSVVRRYRREPSPLVRDAVRGWRTGNVDRVLAGDFDLFTD